MKILFEAFKNKPIINSHVFAKQMTIYYKLPKEQIFELYRNIINYQIARYGQTIDGHSRKYYY